MPGPINRTLSSARQKNRKAEVRPKKKKYFSPGRPENQFFNLCPACSEKKCHIQPNVSTIGTILNPKNVTSSSSVRIINSPPPEAKENIFLVYVVIDYKQSCPLYFKYSALMYDLILISSLVDKITLNKFALKFLRA